MKVQIAALMNDSIVDGPGLRYAIYVQGCPHRCKGCHNPQTHPFDGGTEMDTEDIWNEIEENPLLSGITLSGGDPLCQPKPMAEIAKKAKESGLSVWCYTGYLFEDLIKDQDDDIMALLGYTDVRVDAPFVLEERTLELPFRGSKNQRLVDVPRSLEDGKVKEILL
ncbi:MAG: anaerobic ribonucleoside-triphosphate reductase activating protein [Firmicutes bacterium]|nr:anaerobic ribonucleoside-triphosphate reductase activating protein [Bacillota bacterium]